MALKGVNGVGRRMGRRRSVVHPKQEVVGHEVLQRGRKHAPLLVTRNVLVLGGRPCYTRLGAVLCSLWSTTPAPPCGGALFLPPPHLALSSLLHHQSLSLICYGSLRVPVARLNKFQTKRKKAGEGRRFIWRRTWGHAARGHSGTPVSTARSGGEAFLLSPSCIDHGSIGRVHARQGTFD